ncbi:MAG TPA: dihydrofolate reductase [Bacillota bacterium]
MMAIIAAMDLNRLIGNERSLPWRLPDDQAYFKRLTIGHPVVMGRITFESIGRPLPDRENLVLTRGHEFQAQGCRIMRSIEEVLKYAEARPDTTVFIIGGTQVYTAFLPYVRRLYITLIRDVFTGDRYFPEIDPRDWRLSSETEGAVDNLNPMAHSFLIYDRIPTTTP